MGSSTDESLAAEIRRDDLDIIEMGYVVALQNCNSSVFNIFAIGFTICNSAIAIIVSLAYRNG